MVLKGYILQDFLAGMVVVVYLDTWILRAHVSKDSKERRDAARLLARLQSGVYVVKVPQVIIGEAVATVMRDYDPDEWEEVVGRMMRAIADVADPATCLPPLDTAVVERADQLKARIVGLADTDALLAAQALNDPLAQKVITRDHLLTGSHILKAVDREMRENGEREFALIFGSKA